MEINSILYDKDEYPSKINLASRKQDVSHRLAKLLSYVSLHLSDNSLLSVLIGNVVPSMASNRYNTRFQIAWVNLMREKRLVSQVNSMTNSMLMTNLCASEHQQRLGVPRNSHMVLSLITLMVLSKLWLTIFNVILVQYANSIGGLQSACKPEMVSKIIPI